MKKAELAQAAAVVAAREGNAAWLPVPMRTKAHDEADDDEDGFTGKDADELADAA